MRKTIMRLRSQLGTILDVIKQNGEYMLVTQYGLIAARRKDSDENGVTEMKIFTDELEAQGWKII